MKMSENKGITLISLVVTIIVLLILAGISITTLTGDNGILTKSSKAKDENLKAQILEELNLNTNALKIAEYTEGAKINKENLQKILDESGKQLKIYSTVSDEARNGNLQANEHFTYSKYLNYSKYPFYAKDGEKMYILEPGQQKWENLKYPRVEMYCGKGDYYDGYPLGIYTNFYLPELDDYEYLSTGLLFKSTDTLTELTEQEATNNDSEANIRGTSVIIYRENTEEIHRVYTVNLWGLVNGFYRNTYNGYYFKAFVAMKNKTTGNIEIVYSDVMQAKI